MALKAIVENLDSVPEAIRGEYTEQSGSDGKKFFQLNVESVNGYSLENVSGLRSALEKERSANGEKDKRLAKFGDLDPDKAKEAIGKVAEMANWTPETKVKEQMEAREKQLSEKHAKELKDWQEKHIGLNSQLESLLVDHAATAALGQHELLPGGAKILMPHIKAQIKIFDESGKKIAKVVNADGTPKISNKSGSVGDMTIEEFIAEMKTSPDYALAFKGSGASGSGASGGQGGGGVSTGKTIKSGDTKAMEANLDKIASGEITVID